MVTRVLHLCDIKFLQFTIQAISPQLSRFVRKLLKILYVRNPTYRVDAKVERRVNTELFYLQNCF